MNNITPKLNKRLKRLERQKGLLQEFSGQEIECYEEKKIGENYYIKSWNGTNKCWQVSIYKPESYARYKMY